MNKREQLLTILCEEASEISKECTKSLRFGLYDINPKTPDVNNRRNLVNELNDLLGTVDMLVVNGAIPNDWMNDSQRIKKRDKIEKWLEYSKKRGTLV